MKPVRFHDAARAEIAAEVLYYAAASRVVAERFVKAVQAAVELAAEFSTMGSPYRYGTRRVFPRRFPFSVVHLERPNEVYVLALAPLARRPGYWRSRGSGG